MNQKTQQKVLRWMKANVYEWLDGFGGVDCTALGEAACMEFNLYDEDQDIPNELFGLSFQVQKWWDRLEEETS